MKATGNLTSHTGKKKTKPETVITKCLQSLH